VVRRRKRPACRLKQAGKQDDLGSENDNGLDRMGSLIQERRDGFGSFG
jgi:hypothetical protein